MTRNALRTELLWRYNIRGRHQKLKLMLSCKAFNAKSLCSITNHQHVFPHSAMTHLVLWDPFFSSNPSSSADICVVCFTRRWRVTYFWEFSFVSNCWAVRGMEKLIQHTSPHLAVIPPTDILPQISNSKAIPSLEQILHNPYLFSADKEFVKRCASTHSFGQ